MFERLSDLAEEYARLERDLADAAVHSEPERARALGRRYGELTQATQSLTAERAVKDRELRDYQQTLARN